MPVNDSTFLMSLQLHSRATTYGLTQFISQHSRKIQLQAHIDFIVYSKIITLNKNWVCIGPVQFQYLNCPGVLFFFLFVICSWVFCWLETFSFPYCISKAPFKKKKINLKHCTKRFHSDGHLRHEISGNKGKYRNHYRRCKSHSRNFIIYYMKACLDPGSVNSF